MLSVVITVLLGLRARWAWTWIKNSPDKSVAFKVQELV